MDVTMTFRFSDAQRAMLAQLLEISYDKVNKEILEAFITGRIRNTGVFQEDETGSGVLDPEIIE